MKAYKTFSLCPVDQRPDSVPLSWPWQELECDSTQIVQFENLGFTVVTDEQYLTYKASHQSSYDSWLSNFNNSLKQYRIYNFVENKKDHKLDEEPLSLDFRTSLTKMLHRRSTLIKGECVTEEYYENCSVDAAGNLNYSNLIVSEHHSFTRDPLGFPVMRNSHLHFYDTNGLESPEVKHWIKFYSPLEKIQEGKVRRGNLVDNLQFPVIGLISLALTSNPIPNLTVLVTGRNFLFDYKKEFDAFVDESNKDILECLNNPSHLKYMSASKYPWINSVTPYGVTIRQFLTSELSI